MQPQPFGLYTLINRINVGGMAEVFKACYYDQGRPAFAAIKRILPHLAQDMSFINMFITEAHTAGRLVHPNIAQIIEQGEEEGEYFISMEYVSGRDLLYLRHHLRERGMYFPPALAAYVVQGVASALDYAHRLCDAQGQHLEIIHRDVSPQNILISYDGEVKLIDFGIAKAKVRTQEHTRSGVLKGKFGYMSPEQVKGKTIDHRIDIFALGAVFYELLTNQRLFMGESDIETLELVRTAQVVPPSQLNEWVPPLLDQIVMRALQPEPDQRFQSAGEFAQALQYFIHNEAPMTHQTTLKSWMAKEFSHFIAHEKAQDSYLIEQMVANLEDSAEDMDSTSLISSDVIDQLNQFTAEQLGHNQMSHDEMQVHATIEQTPQVWHHDMPTGPMSGDQLAGLDTSPLVTQDGVNPYDDRFLSQTAPITPEALKSVEFAEKRAQGINSMSEVSLPEYPYSQQTAQPTLMQQQINDDDLEELLEEPFEDSLSDESALYAQNANLDELLSLSLSQGTTSPLRTPVPPQSLSAGAPTPLGVQSPFNSLSAGASTPLGVQAPLTSPFTSLSAGATSPLGVQAPLTSPLTSLSAGATSPLGVQAPLTSPLTSLSAGATSPLSHAVPSFSDYEPTPIPSMRRASLTKPSRSGKGLVMALLILTIVGAGITAWMLYPRTQNINLKVIPVSDQVTVQIGLAPPIQLSQQSMFQIGVGENIRVQHPTLPPWTHQITQEELDRGELEIDLEVNAPKMMLKVDSNRPGAEVWVLGKKRGVTPFHQLVPISLKAKQQGKLQVKIVYESNPPIEKEAKIRKGEFRTWARF